jgi:hypothetical protein
MIAAECCQLNCEQKHQKRMQNCMQSLSECQPDYRRDPPTKESRKAFFSVNFLLIVSVTTEPTSSYADSRTKIQIHPQQ